MLVAECWSGSPALWLDDRHADPEGTLTERCMDNHTGSHAKWEGGFPALGGA